MMQRRGKRGRQTNILLLLIIFILLMVLLWNICAARSQLKKAHNILKKVEVMLSEKVDARMLETENIISTDRVFIEKPIIRTKEEVIKKLSELGKENIVIEEIYKNYTRYPESMLEALANNPEMADFVAGYINNKTTISGLTEAEKKQTFPLFLQWDTRWGYEQYGDNECIGVAGCGPTCMSMVLYYLTRNETLTPDKLADYAMRNHYYLEGTGTIWAFMDDTPALYGVDVKEVSLSEDIMKSELDKGAVMICSMRPGDFTSSGHFIVIYGYDKSGFKINDPNCVARSRKSWAYEEIKNQIKKIWAYEM